MFTYIVCSCIFFSLLIISKIGLQLQELISWKHRLKREEQNNLHSFLNLSKREIAILKYLFLRSNHSAWLPPDMPDTSLLLNKDYIKVIAKNRKYVDPLNFYVSEKDALYTLTETTLTLIGKHKEEFMRRWNKIHIDKTLDKYQ